MPWNTPPTFTAGQVVSATDLNNYLRDNPLYLLSGFPIAVIAFDNGANYTVTGVTWADIDATNLIATVTLKGGRAFVLCACLLEADNTANSKAQVDIIVDSTTRNGGTHGLTQIAQNIRSYVVFFTVFTGLSVGSHTFKPQFRNLTAGAVTTVDCNAAAAGNGAKFLILVWGE